MISVQNLSDTKSDQVLWVLIRKSDVSAFTELFERHHRVLYNYGCKLTSDVSVVEDAVQEVFINVWKLRASLTEDIVSVKFYLFRSIRRIIHRAQSKVLHHTSIQIFEEENIIDPFSDFERQWIEGETNIQVSQDVIRLLKNLPDRQLEALTLRYYEDFKISEIAHIMGVSEKSVRNFIYKGLTSLRANRHYIYR